MRALLVVPLLVLAGCLEPTAPPPAESEPLETRTLLRSQNVEVVEGAMARSLTLAEWDAAWERHATSMEPRPVKPVVEAASERVVAVSLGQRGSGCHAIEIVRAVREAGEIVVTYEVFNGEKEGMVCTAQVVWPTHIVAIDDTSTPLRFVARSTEEPPSPPTSAGEPVDRTSRLPVRTLDRGSFSGVKADRREILRDEASWLTLWAKHRPDTRPPAVDFPHEVVVAVVVHGPTGCFGIHLGNVTRVAGGIEVEVVHETTPDHIQCFTAVEDAYEFAALPRVEGEARYVDKEEPGGETRDAPPARAVPLGPPDQATPTPTPTPGSEPTGNYSFRTLAKGSNSALGERTRRVFETEDAWRAFWAQHAKHESPAPPLPSVDFTRERVFAASLGQKPNQCYGIVVDRIEQHPSNVAITVRSLTPPEGAICGMAISHAYHFVTYPITSRPYLLLEG